MKTHYHRTGPQRELPENQRGVLRLALALCLAGAVAAPSAQAQDTTLDDAIAVYNAAEYGRAVDLFSTVAEAPGTSRADRHQALHFLARSYNADGRYDDARSALDALLDTEPPAVALDPEMEHPRLVRLYYEARRDRQGYDVERPDPGLQTLAVMDFANNSIQERETYEPLEQGFASLMGHYLGGATGLQVVERERVAWLLDELALQRDSALVEQETAVRAGRVLGVHAVLFGSYIVHKNTMRVGARLVKVETGEVLLSEHLFGDPDDFFDLVERLSLQVAQAVNAELERDELRDRRSTQSLDAMLVYSEGLVLAERGRYDEAYGKFMQALDYDPEYARAQRRAASLRPFLASAQ